jgi:hypothetical protein
MKPAPESKLMDLEFEAEPALDRMRALGRRLLAVPKQMAPTKEKGRKRLRRKKADADSR